LLASVEQPFDLLQRVVLFQHQPHGRPGLAKSANRPGKPGDQGRALREPDM
jgi:hypothetical protein